MFYFRKQHIYRSEESGEGDGGSSGESSAEKQANPNAEIEDKARKMGWTPKEEFKGDPEKWRDAADFVERGENMLPLMRAQNKKLEREVAELKQTTREFAEHLSKTEQRAYERALAELKEQRKKAMAAGDADTFDKVDDAITELRNEAAAKAAKREVKGEGDDPVYTEWASRNKWLDDKKLEKEAEAQAIYLRQRGDDRTGVDFLEAVKERVKKEFPEKFENPRREAAPSVESGTPAPRRSGGKTYSDMPAEARAACDRMAKNGFAGDEKAAKAFRDQYVKQYFEEA